MPDCDEGICGTNGITSNDTILTAETRCIAVDPTVIPIGSKVLVNGKLFTASDVGGSIKNRRIDICVYGKTHQEVLAMGRKEVNIRVLQYKKTNP